MHASQIGDKGHDLINVLKKYIFTAECVDHENNDHSYFLVFGKRFIVRTHFKRKMNGRPLEDVLWTNLSCGFSNKPLMLIIFLYIYIILGCC